MLTVLWLPSTAARAIAAFIPLAIVELGFFQRPAFQQRLAREPDLALAVDIGDHHGDFIAFFDHISHFADVAGIQLRDMHQAVLAGENFNKGAEVSNAYHFAGVDMLSLIHI